MFQPFQKKKPSLTIMVGKGKDPESPDPLEKPPMDKPAMAKPFGKQPPAEDTSSHEGAEAPAYEDSEQSGAALIQDIESAGENIGLDAAQSRSFAADLFGAMAECLRRGSGGSGEKEPDTGEDYPA